MTSRASAWETWSRPVSDDLERRLMEIFDISEEEWAAYEHYLDVSGYSGAKREATIQMTAYRKWARQKIIKYVDALSQTSGTLEA